MPVLHTWHGKDLPWLYPEVGSRGFQYNYWNANVTLLMIQSLKWKFLRASAMSVHVSCHGMNSELYDELNHLGRFAAVAPMDTNWQEISHDVSDAVKHFGNFHTLFIWVNMGRMLQAGSLNLSTGKVEQSPEGEWSSLGCWGVFWSGKCLGVAIFRCSEPNDASPSHTCVGYCRLVHQSCQNHPFE